MHQLSIFEAGMLICFGLSWPMSIAKTLRAKRVDGKSPFFMVAVLLGYASGILHKALYSMDWVIALYALNFCMIAFDLRLYFKYRRPKETPAPAA